MQASSEEIRTTATTPTVQALARKDLEAKVTKLMGDYRIPEQTTEIVIALIRQAMQ